jgi:hypothetical protein
VQNQLDISWAELGYGEEVLYGPFATQNYYFRLPATLAPAAGSSIILNLLYEWHQITDSVAGPQPVLATVAVSLDDELLTTAEFTKSTSTTLAVDLPTEALALPPGDRSKLTINLTVSGDCEHIKQTTLVVKDTSALHMVYTRRPLVLDLGLYPYPFYQGSLEPDQVRFVLPAQPSSQDVAAAAAIAGRLGALTSNRIEIHAGKDSTAVLQEQAREHLIAVGTPQSNELIAWLNENAEVPMRLQPRQLEMVTRGPAMATGGEQVTVEAVVTNTTDGTVPSLELRAQPPGELEVVGCQPECEQDTGEIVWSSGALAPGAEFRAAVRLSVGEVLTRTVVECPFALSG